ncbi:MAG: hypothetical protein J2P17_35405, partial [Mycobacterium sp.]|nr:hypothetical protein [Mycobacterium sp.]
NFNALSVGYAELALPELGLVAMFHRISSFRSVTALEIILGQEHLVRRLTSLPPATVSLTIAKRYIEKPEPSRTEPP